MTILRQVRRMVFLAGVLMLPMLGDGVGDFDQPSAVFRNLQNIRRGEILGGVLGGIGKRIGTKIRRTVCEPSWCLWAFDRRWLASRNRIKTFPLNSLAMVA